MLVFGVTVTEVRKRDFPVHYPWHIRVVSTPDEFGRLEGKDAVGVEKDDAWSRLVCDLVAACGVDEDEIVLDELPVIPRQRRRRV